MLIKVKFFAALRERANRSGMELRLPKKATVADLLKDIGAMLNDDTLLATCVVAVNNEYAAPQRVLRDGDTVAIIPPVSGGEIGRAHV